MIIENSINTPLTELIRTWQVQTGSSTYFGVPAVKNPADAWIYQEIIFNEKPDVIVEVGVKHGGSTLMYAHWLDSIGKGKVIGVDISLELVPEIVRNHPRITLLEGDANARFADVKNLIKPTDRVLVIEDSAHTYEHTVHVLQNYSTLIAIGDYFIVEDGICYEGVFDDARFDVSHAIYDFLQEGNFVSDRSKEPYVITWNPRGFLKRVK